MEEASAAIRRFGGIARTRDLARVHVSAHALRMAVRGGEVIRVRQGWYTTLPTTDPRVVAVAVGGRLTGLAALNLAGAWLWKRPRVVDVLLPPSAGARRAASGVKVTRGTAPGRGVVVPLRSALLHALPRVSFEEAVAILDWALRTGGLDELDLLEVVNALPRRLRGLAKWTDDRCESVLESVVRTRLRQAGFSVTSQVPVGFLQAIDLVVDDVVGIELDGYEYHRNSFENDRSKDLSIVTEGRTAIRASYRLVDEEWPRVLAAVSAAALAHRRAPVRGGRPRPRGMPAATNRLPPS